VIEVYEQYLNISKYYLLTEGRPHLSVDMVSRYYRQMCRGFNSNRCSGL